MKGLHFQLSHFLGMHLWLKNDFPIVRLLRAAGVGSRVGFLNDLGCNPWSPLGSRRAAALQKGLRQAVAVPLELAETVASLWPVLQELALCVNLACRSDLQVHGGAWPPTVVGHWAVTDVHGCLPSEAWAGARPRWSGCVNLV